MGESSFLSQFLMITDLKTVIFIAVLIGTFFIVKQFEKKKVKFSTRTIYATIIGLILGVIIQLVAGLPENPAEYDGHVPEDGRLRHCQELPKYHVGYYAQKAHP